jgi:hypothetical protein
MAADIAQKHTAPSKNSKTSLARILVKLSATPRNGRKVIYEHAHEFHFVGRQQSEGLGHE